MPEIKNAFIKGKMNTDLDERLIPNGEYRDALNVDVDFSEGSSVGALKNILGTTQRDSITLSSARCIGSVKDTENSKIYWFITSSAKDLITEWNYASNTYDTIIVDSGSVLNFNASNLITGANVIDGILFFTDNLNEPRQVDIEYWRGQTSGSAGTSSGLSAERITVIRKSPLAAPTLEMSSSSRGGNGTTGNTAIFIDAHLGTSDSAGNLGTPRDSGYNFSSSQAGISKFKVAGGTATDPNYQANDVIILTHKFTESDDTVKTIKVRIKLAGNYSQQGGSNAGVFSNAEILTISEKVPLEAVLWTCILEEDEPLFKEKFPRFAYRYKYNNGQYSCFSPFTNAAFLPDPTVGAGTGVEYDAKSGANLAMVNSLRSLKLKDLNHNTHADVEEIDIVYKDSVSPNCYLVDTIKRNSSNAFPDPLEFEVKDDQIFKTLPSNQLLRLFDSVPKKAKSQEITANRLIYGNYTENFNLKDSSNNNVEPVFSVGIHNRYNPTDSGYADNRKQRQSIKSKRKYQFGVVYMDEFGRQTPVLTSKTGVVKVGQEGASFLSRFKAAITSNPPAFAKTYKYFIKEISSTTHNFIGDSFYQDKEGFIYIAIPSADINKVGVDDTIVLKKKRGNDISNITEEFKVLDKYTTPPPFLAKPLKETYVPDVFVFSKNLEQDRDLHLLKPGSSPVPGRNRITVAAMYKLQETNIDSGGAIGNDTKRGVSREAYALLNPGAKVKFVTGSGETDVYTIANKELDLGQDNDFELHFTQEFGDDVKILYDDFDKDKLLNPSGTENGATLVGGDASLNVDSNEVYGGGIKMVVVDTVDESGKEEYQGKFFIKIKNDTNLLTELKGEEDLNNLQVLSTISLDGNQNDDDPRQFHMYGGGKANTDSSVTRLGGSGPLNPQAGGFNGNTNHLGTSAGQSYRGDRGFITNSELDQGYHFCIRTDKSYADKNSKYATLPLITGLEKAPSNKNNYNTDNPVYLKFDRSRTQIAAGQAADNNVYKITRVFKYLERGSGVGAFDDGDGVYLIKLDKNLAQNLIFNGDVEPSTTGTEANIMQISVLEFRKDDQLVGIPEPPIFEVLPKDDVDIDIYFETQEVFTIASDGTNNHGNVNTLSYYNCFSFDNGVESLSIRDNFNTPAIGKGVRVSTIFEDKPYIEETLKNNLIFSQIYNGKNALNRLNQFIIAEDITKELNPDYGSIQLLHTRYNDIIAYCENKVVKILTNKDALFNADGNVNVTSNKAVLGQANPYSSNFGIGTNPESFDEFLFRSYFVDAKSGAVVRHSMDGMEAISDYGMKDYFRDNLNLQSGFIYGSYDVVKGQYNVSLPVGVNTTLSFSESINGWCSRKSYINEGGVSMHNKYFTFKSGHIHEHHVGTRNTFYGVATTPFVEFIFNESPANMKNFRTLNYEGDSGWACLSIVTDQQDGAVDSFVNKENKYFNYIRGKAENASTIDLKALNVQGIGVYNTVTNNSGNTVTYSFTNNVPQDLQKGDTLYFVHPTGSAVTAVGAVTVVTATSVTASYSTVPPISGSFSKYFVFYAKNARWQTSGLLGYFATVKMQNTSTDSKELYSVGSEVSISS